MRLHIGVDAEHLVQMLGMNLQKEQEQWKPKTYKSVDANSSVRSYFKESPRICYEPPQHQNLDPSLIPYNANVLLYLHFVPKQI